MQQQQSMTTLSSTSEQVPDATGRTIGLGVMITDQRVYLPENIETAAFHQSPKHCSFAGLAGYGVPAVIESPSRFQEEIDSPEVPTSNSPI